MHCRYISIIFYCQIIYHELDADQDKNCEVVAVLLLTQNHELLNVGNKIFIHNIYPLTEHSY